MHTVRCNWLQQRCVLWNYDTPSYLSDLGLRDYAPE